MGTEAKQADMGYLALTFLPFTQYVIYFCSAFILVPGGRDIVAPGHPLLPKDAEAFKMFGGNPIMWRAWGLLWYAFSTMEIWAVYTGTAEVLAIAAVYEIALVISFIPGIKESANYGADIMPFIDLFGLESVALAVSVLM